MHVSLKGNLIPHTHTHTHTQPMDN